MINTRFLALIVMAAFIASCSKKENTNSVPLYGSYSNMDTIFQMLSVKSKIVSIDAATGGSFYGNSGTRYAFPPSCFVDGVGNTVTGYVQIEVAEYLKKGDMVFSKMLPLSDGMQLVSGGQISVKGTSAGSEVFIKPGMLFTANVPQASTPPLPMLYFSGSLAQDTTGSRVNWRTPIDSVPGKGIVFVQSNTVQPVDSLRFICDSMKWINSDRYIAANDVQTFTVNLSAVGGSLNSKSDIRFYIFVDKVSSLYYDSYSHSDFVYSLRYDKTPVHFVAFGMVDNKFYAGLFPTTPNNGASYDMHLTEVKPEDFKAQLNNL